MSDYIDRQAALHYIADWQYGEAKVGNEAVFDTIEKCYKMIEQLPSVQPQRMRRGYWKSDDSVCTIKQFECSVCEELVEVPMILNEIQWHFCPHCGAKMEGRDE